MEWGEGSTQDLDRVIRVGLFILRMDFCSDLRRWAPKTKGSYFFWEEDSFKNELGIGDEESISMKTYKNSKHHNPRFQRSRFAILSVGDGESVVVVKNVGDEKFF